MVGSGRWGLRQHGRIGDGVPEVDWGDDGRGYWGWNRRNTMEDLGPADTLGKATEGDTMGDDRGRWVQGRIEMIEIGLN